VARKYIAKLSIVVICIRAPCTEGLCSSLSRDRRVSTTRARGDTSRDATSRNVEEKPASAVFQRALSYCRNSYGICDGRYVATLLVERFPNPPLPGSSIRNLGPLSQRCQP
jgi:hypothetical protein